jgi:hypothetical protein
MARFPIPHGGLIPREMKTYVHKNFVHGRAQQDHSKQPSAGNDRKQSTCNRRIDKQNVVWRVTEYYCVIK